VGGVGDIVFALPRLVSAVIIGGEVMMLGEWLGGDETKESKSSHESTAPIPKPVE
jgi:hypothetical protein